MIAGEKYSSNFGSAAAPAGREVPIGIVAVRSGCGIETIRFYEKAGVLPRGELRVEIRGALAGILALSASNDRTARVSAGGSVSVLGEQIKMVAGERSHLYRTTISSSLSYRPSSPTAPKGKPSLVNIIPQ